MMLRTIHQHATGPSPFRGPEPALLLVLDERNHQRLYSLRGARIVRSTAPGAGAGIP
jgi:hypothetical protein